MKFKPKAYPAPVRTAKTEQRRANTLRKLSQRVDACSCGSLRFRSSGDTVKCRECGK